MMIEFKSFELSEKTAVLRLDYQAYTKNFKIKVDKTSTYVCSHWSK